MAKYSLEIDSGVIEIDLKDKNGNVIGSFEFAPSDSNIVARYTDVINNFNAVKAPVVLEGEDEEEVMRGFYLRFSEIIKEQLDYLLGRKVSERIFVHCGPLSVLENGDFFYEQVLEGIGNLIESVVGDRLDRKISKINAATEKYNHE